MLTASQQSSNFENPTPQWPVLSFIRMLWIRRFHILAVWIVLSAAAVTVVLKWPATYRAETLIVVDQQRIPEKFVSAAVSVELQDRLATISQEILSNTQLQKIMESRGLYESERRRLAIEEVLDLMRGDIRVTMEKGWIQNRPGAFRVSYEGRDPAMVAQVANQLGNLFIEENLRNRETIATGTSDFMRSQLEEGKKNLEAQEKKLSDFKTSHNGELPQQEAELAQELSRLQLQLQGNQDALNRAAQNKITVESALSVAQSTEAALGRLIQAKGDGRIGFAAAAQAGVKKSEQMEAELAELKVRYTSRYPGVIDLAAAVQAAKAREQQASKGSDVEASSKDVEASSKRDAPVSAEAIQTAAAQRERVEAINAQLTVINGELATRQADRDKILKAIEGVQARLHRLPVREQEMAEVTRDYETSKSNYNALQEKIFAADMATDMERRQKSERFTVVDPARVPEKPISPNRPRLRIIGCVGSLAVSIGIWLLCEIRKNKFLGEWELPEGAVILGRVPALPVHRRHLKHRRTQGRDHQEVAFVTGH